MSFSRVPSLAEILCVLLFTGVTAASGEGAPPDDGQQRLVERYVEAVRSRDADALRALYHPKGLACIDESNQVAADAKITAPFALSIPEDYSVTVYEGGESTGPGWMKLLYGTGIDFRASGS